MMKNLVESECGGQNSLVKLTNHFTSSNEHKFAKEALNNSTAITRSDALANEYLNSSNGASRTAIVAPRTFQMDSLLNELIQKSSTPPPPQTTTDWSQDYLNSITSAFSGQLANQQHQKNNSAKYDNGFKWSTEYLNQNEIQTPVNNNNSIANNIKSNTVDTLASTQLNEDMRKTANELLDTMQDSPFSETEFTQFVRNLSINGNNLNARNNIIASTSADSAQKSSKDTSVNNDLASEWVKDFEKDENNINKAKNIDDTITNGSFWDDLQDEWDIAASNDPTHPWLDEFQKVFDTYKIYEFDRENPLQSHPNPYEEGLERLKLHDIVNAVLLFEAAVQKDPTNMNAWQYLGTTQVENEQDAQAIRALRKCLELKPDNLVALSTLATSYTNESMQRLAFQSLLKWLKYNSKYSHLLRNDEQAERLVRDLDETASSTTVNPNNTQSTLYMNSLGIVHIRDFIDLQEIFLKAVRESSTSSSNKQQIDPNLQCCLGILFHLSGEYDKAADCFKTALQVKPDDHLLWNKLGATLANNNRNEEAIDAYFQALKLCPGFVRARYNLGIGCMNLGAYKESIEHFLTALDQQNQANINGNIKTSATNVSASKQQMSETIWNTLRLSLSYLNRQDLYGACLNKELDELKREFNI